MMDKVSQVSDLVKDQLGNITIDRVFDWTIGARLFDLGDLIPQVRSVAWLGYGTILAQLAALLIFELAGETSASTDTLTSPGIAVRMPAFVVVITSVGFLIGWAFVLTGMLYVRLRIALPLYVLFLTQMLIFGSAVAMDVLVFAALVGILQILARFNCRIRNWKGLAVGALVVWFLLLGRLGYLVWNHYPSIDSLAGALNGTMQFAAVLAYGLWFAMACGVIVTAVRVSIFIVKNLGRIVAGRHFQFLVFILLLAQALGEFIFGIINRAPAWIANGSLTLLLVLVTVVLWFTRRWNDRTAAIVCGISLTLFVFASSLSVIFADLMHRRHPTQMVEFFSPLLLFLIITADNLLRFGKPIKVLACWLGSQVAWVLIYFGLIVIVISALMYLLNYRSLSPGQTTSQVQNALNGLSLGAMSLSGPLYLAWVLIRHREWWSKPMRMADGQVRAE